jgi:hypothetical protein
MADIDVHYDPITVNTDTTTVEIQGLDNIKTAITLATPAPLKAETKSDLNLQQVFKSDSKFDLILPQPLKTESAAELDVKPLALDQCLRISFGPVPPTCVRQPYQQHFGFTLFGVEIFGLNVQGEAQLMVCDLPSKPHVVWGEEQSGTHQSSRQTDSGEPPASSGSLKIRLDQ